MDSRTSVKPFKTEPQRGRKRPAEDQLNALWEQYTERHDIETRNELIEAYMSIVRREARKVAVALSYVVSTQELESAGTLGLIDSIDHFDPSQGFKFVTFCTPRVRGAILDELRSWDWTPRATRAKLNKLGCAVTALEGRFGRAPDLEEIADEMSLTQDEVRQLFSDKDRSIVSLDAPMAPRSDGGAAADPPSAILEDKREADPVRRLQKKEVADAVRRMLSKTERLVVTLYYYEQLNLREIGHVLRLTESRICQIHGEIVQRLKKRLA